MAFVNPKNTFVHDHARTKHHHLPSSILKTDWQISLAYIFNFLFFKMLKPMIKTSLFNLTFGLTLALTLTACGQKGALHLPQKSLVSPQSESMDTPVSTDPNDY
ncbi:hypothetical protein A9Z60_09270 [Moraxella nonliquefaciens]|uniref:Lipoprotein n=2 Tax=Moraxella nonliquefaciens TaxID=478 RepID=A0A1B8PJK9_MORNO|nr:hypothetical protein A9Z60_09270 [Moraxella nonliquefaciens]